MIIQCIPDYREIDMWAEAAEKNKLCFEYNEFFNPQVLENQTLIDNIISRYQSLGRDMSQDTLHGAFFDIVINSMDTRIREASKYRIEQSVEIAEKMGLRGVVFHTNYITGFRSKSYRESWVMENVEFWKNICEVHPKMNIYLENMFDESPELLKKVAELLVDVPNFGVCLDIAHARLSEKSVDEFVTELSSYVRHIHINDNDGFSDLHQAVGDGVINWNVLKNDMLLKNDPSILIEVSSYENLEKSIRYLKQNGLIF